LLFTERKIIVKDGYQIQFTTTVDALLQKFLKSLLLITSHKVARTEEYFAVAIEYAQYWKSTHLEEKTSVDLKYFLKLDPLSILIKVRFESSKWWNRLHNISHLSLQVLANVPHFNIRPPGTC
jgi:hypothetical protein